MKRQRALLILAVAAAICLAGPYFAERSVQERKGPTPAPFSVRYGDLALSIPLRPDLRRAAKYDNWLRMTICDRRASRELVEGCKDLKSPLVNRHGLILLISAARPEMHSVLLGERPALTAAPAPEPLLDIPQSKISKDLLHKQSEAYELSRIALGQSAESRAFQTTSLNWPIVACKDAVKGRSCGIGFLLKGAFVELHFSPETGADPNQTEVWNIATAVDAKLRGLIEPADRRE